MLIGSDEPSGLPASSAGYTRAVLMIYDLWVTHFSNRYVWRCSVDIHRDHYRKWIGKRHLEVGVGTGYYLSGATLREVQHVALLDPNPLCLGCKTAHTLRFMHDILQRRSFADLYSGRTV